MRHLATALGIAALLLAAFAAWAGYYPWRYQIGPEQPIAFSHRVHVNTKNISCVMCHTGVFDTPRAGIPPLETCMLCHERIITAHPQIVNLRSHYDAREPVKWTRVNDLRDYVYFNHQRHIQRGFDCGRCHGDVGAMDRVALVQPFKMGFCVECHRQNNYSVDCLTCHR